MFLQKEQLMFKSYSPVNVHVHGLYTSLMCVCVSHDFLQIFQKLFVLTLDNNFAFDCHKSEVLGFTLFIYRKKRFA